MSDPSPTVFVVDDDASVRRSLRRLLASAGYSVELFASADAFLKREPGDGTGCIVLDLRMDGMGGMELQERLAEQGCSLPIVFLTGHGEIPASVQAMKRGAEDFLTKPVDEETLLHAVERALERHREVLATRQSEAAIQSHLDTLTTREAEVLRCMLSGALNKQIAARLGIAEKTVKVHRARVFEKMGVRSLPELTRMCAAVNVDPDTA